MVIHHQYVQQMFQDQVSPFQLDMLPTQINLAILFKLIALRMA